MKMTNNLKELKKIQDEWVRHQIIDRECFEKDIYFFNDEITKASKEIARIKKCIESYYRSLFSSINDANDSFRICANKDAISRFNENGIEGAFIYVEDARRLFFDDEQCKRLQDYKCISISNDYAASYNGDSVNYTFTNGKVTFLLKVPIKVSSELLMHEYWRAEESGDGFDICRLASYGKVKISLLNASEDDGERILFQSYSIIDIRKALVKLANSDFEVEIEDDSVKSAIGISDDYEENYDLD